jgi:hypothetical protein
VTFNDLTQMSEYPFAYDRGYSAVATDPSNVVAARLSLDGAQVQAWTFSAPSVTVPERFIFGFLLPDGQHDVKLEVQDAIGNLTTKTASFLRERVPPSSCTLIATIDPSDWQRVNLAVTTADLGSSIAYLIIFIDDQDAQPHVGIHSQPGELVSRSIQTIALPEGQHRITVKCFDTQDNGLASPEQTVFLAPPCNTVAVAGNNQVNIQTFNMGKSSGTAELVFRTFVIDDRIRVMGVNNAIVADTGCAVTGGDPDTGAPQSETFTFTGTSKLTVRVDPNCNPNNSSPNTVWDYRLTCP